MGFLGSITDAFKTGIGRGHNAPRWQLFHDINFLRRQKKLDEGLIEGLKGTLEEWYGNEHLRELISPAFESRQVAAESGTIRSAAAATKRNIRETAGQQNLGKAFAARQEFLTDVGAGAQIAQSRGRQSMRRSVFGAEREEKYSTGKSQIQQAEHGLAASRNQAMLGSLSGYNQGVGQRREEQAAGIRNMIEGAIKGGIAGGPLGAVAGGVGGGFGLDPQMMSQMFGGMQSQMPQTQGFNPLLGFALGAGGPFGALANFMPGGSMMNMMGAGSMMQQGMSPMQQMQMLAASKQGGSY